MTTSVSPTILFASMPGHRVTVEHVVTWDQPGINADSRLHVYVDGVHIGSVDVPRMLPAVSGAAGPTSLDPACGVAAGPGEHHP